MTLLRSTSSTIIPDTPRSEASLEYLEGEQHVPENSEQNSLESEYPDDVDVTSPVIHRASIQVYPTGTPSETSIESRGLSESDFGRVARFSPWFPNVNPKHYEAKGWRSWRIWHSKRHILLWLAFTSSTFVLLTNVVLVAVLGSKYGIQSQRGLIKLYKGDCDRAKTIGLGSHVGINILSTLLLGASNLCMQLLVAPTRREIDAAHKKKMWLDIGIPSLKNLSTLPYGRLCLLSLLMLSSVPLHFIYNSAISISIPQYGYPTVVASEHFVRGTDHSIGNWTDIISQGVSPKGWNRWPSTDIWDNWQAFDQIKASANNTALYERLENRQCVERYSNVFSNRSSLVVVTENLPGDEQNSVHQYIYWPATYGGYSRYNPCNSDGDYEQNNPNCQELNKNTETTYIGWKRYGRTVLYCLSERITDHCQVNYSPTIFIAVCCFSVVKCICILLTIFLHKEPTISTIGDAIASFLEFSDETSAHMGPVDKSMFTTRDSTAWDQVTVSEWRPKTTRWFRVPSWRRWFISVFLCLSVIIAALACGIPGALGSQKRLPSMTFAWQMKQPIGVPNPNAFTAYFLERYGTKGFIANVMYANMWQVIISFLYLAYNALLTTMLVGEEWSRFAHSRKTLRVTHPRGIQRSTYFISMPYKYGIPLMIANTVLHILISQSLFIINTITYYPNMVEDLERSYTVTGYSTSGIIISTCVGTTTVLILIGVSFVKVSSGIPLVSTCSIAISAACHRPYEDIDAHLLPVRWGVVSPDADVPVRCSFTTLKGVRSPKVGEQIAGQSSRCDVDWAPKHVSMAGPIWERLLAWSRKLVRRKSQKKQN